MEKPKIKAFFMLLCLLLATLPAAADIFTVNGIEYTTLDSYTCELTNGKRASGELIIPTTVRDFIFDYTVTSIGERAFEDCSSLTSVEIPNSVTSIGYKAFYKCSSLTSVEIPNSVTNIGKMAFYTCDGLTSVKIPKYVTSIGNWAFSNCCNLKKIIVDSDNPAYSSIDGVLFNREKSTLICCPGGFTGEYIIPNSVNFIDAYAFDGCSSLTSVEIPNALISIGNYVFYGCGMTSVVIPNSVISIGKNAFDRCRSLTSVKIPNSVTSIGKDAFLFCYSLTSVEISASVTSLAERVFFMCENLKEIIVDSNNPAYSSVNGVLFNRGKTTLILCPQGFTGEFNIPNSVTSIGHAAFFSCTSLTSVEIPNSVTSIGYCAFEGCTGLVSVVIPNSVTSIGQQVFNCCSSLTSVEIPNSVTSIGDFAFCDCSSLTSVQIPNSVTSIGEKAFSGCKNLGTVYYLAADPIEGSSDIFKGNAYQNATLYVSPQGYEKAKTIAPWRYFRNIEVRETEGIADAVADDADTELYDLNGRRVDNPSSGFYIRRRGTTTEKVIIR